MICPQTEVECDYCLADRMCQPEPTPPPTLADFERLLQAHGKAHYEWGYAAGALSERPAPTREQVREILRSLDIEEKTMTSLTHAPLACWYGLTDPGKIMEFATKLVTSSARSPSQQ